MNVRSLRGIVAVVLLVASSAAAVRAADAPSKPFLHPLFQSSMVLQREVADPVWGWTTPGKEVSLTIGGKTVTATAGADGKWLAKVGPLQVGGPYELTVASGDQQVKLSDILVGDVWVCSGQSNMEMGIGGATNGAQEIEQADHPKLRLFTVPKRIAYQPEDLFPKDLPPDKAKEATWLVCTPQNVKVGDWAGFSAAGYFFGRDLQKELDIPIGLIHTSWGGTIAEAWTSEEALHPIKDFDGGIEAVKGQASNASTEPIEVQTAKWIQRVDPGSAEGFPWAAQKLDEADWKPINLPGQWKRSNVQLDQHEGIVWFRKTIDLPADWLGEQLKLSLAEAGERCVVWANGTKIGESDQAGAARQYVIPGALVKNPTLVLAIRVYATNGSGGLGGNPQQFRLEGPEHQTQPLAGAWKFKASADLAKVGRPPQARQNNPNQPTVLYNGMIHPLLPFAIKGATWYQGESNADRAAQYRKLLPTMVGDWRNRFGVGEFPFYIVQLAAFMDEAKEPPARSQWAELREAQDYTAHKVGKSGIAVLTDIGEAKDIHPHNKQEVGRRLALNALGITYGKTVEYSGPTYKAMSPRGSEVVLQFDHLGGGLEAKGDGLKGFSIAGEDAKFVWADAKIDGDTVVVSSGQVAHPTAVRYAWENNPAKANLYNKAGLPAPPFRTDAPDDEHPPIRVACVGDSITVGVGTANAALESYPSQLGQMLGSRYEVKNFGVSATTLLNHGDLPYQTRGLLREALAFQPQIVVIMLGTNDTKPQNWKFKEEFEADYKDLISKFTSLPSKPQIFICRPVPVPPPGNYGINEEGVQGELPIIDSVAKQTQATIIDMHAALDGKPEMLPDRVHPNAAGAKLMAEAASKVLKSAAHEPAASR